MLFQYRKFPSAATHIRLVEVQAAANNEHQGITIKLHTVPFEDAPCYQAVSYTWGDNLVSKWIWIANDHGPPKMMNIGINCCLALDQIKRFGTTQYFWIDAICINQQDLDEKSHQVAMMGKIFERANSVFASVGEHAQDTEYLV
ncbi:HET-domain-containing protein, partial [Periconia macrospinosa]